MSDDLISVIQVAQLLGKRKQSVFKLIKRLGIEQVKARGEGSRGQLVSYIHLSDFERLKSEWSLPRDRSKALSKREPFGVFYLIQLEPEHDPARIKVGFATHIDERLRSHRTAAPLSRLVKTWPCKALWEKTAIDSVCNDYERLHTEVFRALSIEDAEARCERFFSVMPRVGS